MLFICLYFLSFLLYEKTPAGKVSLYLYHQLCNSSITDFFDGAKMYAQALDGRPHKIKGSLNFTLPAANPERDHDTRFTLVSITPVANNSLNNNPANTMEVKSGHATFSFKYFIALPFIILINLWISSLILFRPKAINVLISFVSLAICLAIEFYCYLLFFRSGASFLPSLNLSSFSSKIISIINSLSGIEWVYIKAIVCYAAFSFRQISRVIGV
ncbi:MAG: hypothetical protein HOP11_15230 [Saprospiraceae bacterium]|nr:hypothetical protein [Saprospiraceae bacterium]